METGLINVPKNGTYELLVNGKFYKTLGLKGVGGEHVNDQTVKFSVNGSPYYDFYNGVGFGSDITIENIKFENNNDFDIEIAYGVNTQVITDDRSVFSGNISVSDNEVKKALDEIKAITEISKNHLNTLALAGQSSSNKVGKLFATIGSTSGQYLWDLVKAEENKNGIIIRSISSKGDLFIYVDDNILFGNFDKSNEWLMPLVIDAGSKVTFYGNTGTITHINYDVFDDKGISYNFKKSVFSNDLKVYTVQTSTVVTSNQGKIQYSTDGTNWQDTPIKIKCVNTNVVKLYTRLVDPLTGDAILTLPPLSYTPLPETNIWANRVKTDAIGANITFGGADYGHSGTASVSSVYSDAYGLDEANHAVAGQPQATLTVILDKEAYLTRLDIDKGLNNIQRYKRVRVRLYDVSNNMVNEQTIHNNTDRALIDYMAGTIFKVKKIEVYGDDRVGTDPTLTLNGLYLSNEA